MVYETQSGLTCRKFLQAVAFVVAVLVVVAVATLIGQAFHSDPYGSVFLHALFGALAAVLLWAGWAASLGAVTLLVTEELVQLAIEMDSPTLRVNSVAGLSIGYIATVLVYIIISIVWFGAPVYQTPDELQWRSRSFARPTQTSAYANAQQQ
jgi:hypothetical protein